MKALQNYTLVWILSLALVACATAPAPESNLERLSYLEISYGVILDKATLYANEGKLSDAQKAKLTESFDAYEVARNLAQIAVESNDTGGFNNQAASINTILSGLRSVLAEASQ